jgi:3-methyladenine DNA glycosylase AlkD
MPPLAQTVLQRLQAAYLAAADPRQAIPMAAYMRGQFEFLGIPAPRQRSLNRTILHGRDRPGEADLRELALACWALPPREYQYFATGWLRRHVSGCGPGFIDTARYLVTTKSWWDTVDHLATHVVGPLVAAHPQLVATMDIWIGEPNLWLYARAPERAGSAATARQAVALRRAPR